jgi:hypothetical protein
MKRLAMKTFIMHMLGWRRHMQEFEHHTFVQATVRHLKQMPIHCIHVGWTKEVTM